MLQRVDLSELARLILEQTLADCSIERAMAQRVLLVEGEGNARVLAFGESIIDLAHFKRVRIVAVGKAAPAMLKAVLPLLPTPLHCDLAGIVISHLRPTDLPKTFKFFAGGHPVPNANSFAGARAVLAMLEDLPETAPNLRDTLCLFLISGGASAMMELPIDPAITLEDTVLYHRALVNCGATITEINCVRKHFSAVKGGRLAIAANRAECLSLLVSDVPVGHPEIVASGPTLPDISTADECRAILNRYSLFEHFPDSVRRFFASSELSETPKPESLTARAWILLDANDLAEAARQRAEQLGFHAVIDTTCGDLEYRAASAHLLDRLRVLRREHARVCLISVGEAAVSLPRISIDGGTADDRIGGRNQHLALYAATLFQTSDEPIAFLSAGSDGIDGNSLAAGAVVNEHTLSAASSRVLRSDSAPLDERLDFEAQTALQQFRSFAFLEASGATIMLKPTENNIRDLRILLAEQPPRAELATSTHQVSSDRMTPA